MMTQLRKIILFVAVILLALGLQAQNTEATSSDYSDQELDKINLKEVCRIIGISSNYKDRYEFIILPLCEHGVKIFDGKLNKYVNGTDIASLEKNFCYYYIGNILQNAKLKRNLIKNRHLFKDGKLIKNAAKLWVVVE
jgi:hypothetical protein